MSAESAAVAAGRRWAPIAPPDDKPYASPSLSEHGIERRRIDRTRRHGSADQHAAMGQDDTPRDALPSRRLVSGRPRRTPGVVDGDVAVENRREVHRASHVAAVAA